MKQFQLSCVEIHRLHRHGSAPAVSRIWYPDPSATITREHGLVEDKLGFNTVHEFYAIHLLKGKGWNPEINSPTWSYMMIFSIIFIIPFLEDPAHWFYRKPVCATSGSLHYNYKRTLFIACPAPSRDRFGCFFLWSIVGVNGLFLPGFLKGQIRIRRQEGSCPWQRIGISLPVTFALLGIGHTSSVTFPSLSLRGDLFMKHRSVLA